MNSLLPTKQLLNLLDQAINEMRPERLAEQIEELSEHALQQFDPVRFGFVQALGRKMQQQRDSVSVLLFDKLKKALQQLRDQVQATELRSEQLLRVIVDEFPDMESNARQLVERGDHSQLKKLVDGLYRKQLEAPSLFKSLIDDLSQPDSRPVVKPAVEASAEIADMTIPRQGELLPAADASAGDKTARGGPRELRALTPLRESWAKLNAEKLVMRSINEGPENAGPLNPHYLAIRSLSNMRDLSPHYLNRFVAYMETLLWLEKAAAKKPGTKRKKSPGKK